MNFDGILNDLYICTIMSLPCEETAIAIYEINGEKKLTKIHSPGSRKFVATINRKQIYTTGRGFNLRSQLDDALRNLMNKSYSGSGKFNLTEIFLIGDNKAQIKIQLSKDLIMKYKIN
jgi:hypothetical protein